MKDTVAIILAGGEGKRFGMHKQFIPIYGVPVFMHTLVKFDGMDVILVAPTAYHSVVQNTLSYYKPSGSVKTVQGGNTRQESVYNALSHINNYCKYKNVVITDANRPCIARSTVSKCVAELKNNKAVATICKSINTSCTSGDGVYLGKVLDRRKMYELLMPQCFDFKLLWLAHQNTNKSDASDDTQLLPSAVKIKLVEISIWESLKLTNPDDYKIFETLLRG